jgi:Flp pilus assembly protein TadG
MTRRPKRESARRQSPVGKTTRLAQRGSSLVEMAFVLTFLLAVLFGIIDFSRALYTYHFVSNAAREASRWASVRGSACNEDLLTGCPAAPGTGGNVGTFVSNVGGMGLDPARITTTTSLVASPTSIPPCASATNHPGCIVQVKVDYAYHFIFPFLPSDFTMSSTSQMVISQ